MTVPIGGMGIHSEGVPNGFANPMTAPGDLIVGGVAGTPTRLAVGGEGKVLTVIAGVPAWPADAAAGVDAVAASWTVTAPLSRGAGAPAKLFIQVGVPHASDGVLQTPTTTFALAGDGSLTLGLAAATISAGAPYTTDTNVGLRVSSKMQVYRVGSPSSYRAFRVNTSFAAPSPVLNTDGLGSLEFGGYDGANVLSFVQIGATATQNYAVGANGSKLTISTTPNGSAVFLLALTIDQDQTTTFTQSMGIGTGPVAGEMFHAQKDQNAATKMAISNQTSGAAAFTQMTVNANAAQLETYAFSTGWTTVNQFIAAAGVVNATGLGGLNLATSNGGGAAFIRFYTNSVLRGTINDSTGAVSWTGAMAVGGVALSASTALIVPAGVAGVSPFRIPHGVAPTAPVNGDMWTTTAGLFVRINGVTVGPLT